MDIAYQNPAATNATFTQWLQSLPCAFDTEAQGVLQHAWEMAHAVYGAGERNTGMTYCMHGRAVAGLLAGMSPDRDILIAGLLHGLPHLQAFERRQLAGEFGTAVAELIDGAAKIDALSRLDPKREGQVEALRKMLLAMARDIRVVFIALAVRLVDLRHPGQLSATALRHMARQTLDLYTPLANRLGIGEFKWALQDLSLRILEPDSYHRIAQLLAARRTEREDEIEMLRRRMAAALHAAGIQAEILGRPKHIYSIWSKMQQKGLDFDGLFDIRAFRVLVDTVTQCYEALTVIHELWTPLTAEYTDYIAAPKANNYRSLHTVVRGPDGRNLEVQLRTHEMHEQAELGVSAHWRYKEGGRHDASFDAKVAWLRELLHWAQTEAGEYDPIERHRTELFEDRVYVLTPQGDVIDLPRGATPLDFAYHIHTQIGHHCRGARVNDKMVALTHQLETGDRVAVLTANNAAPSRDWLNPELGYLAGSRARARVRAWFRSRDFDRNVADGRTQLERELRRHGGERTLRMEELARHADFATLNEFLAAIGRGEFTATQIAHLLCRQQPRPRIETAAEPATRHGTTGSRASRQVIIDGVDNLVTRLAGCCQPDTKDAIIGYITRHDGIAVHRSDCANVRRLDPEARARLIRAAWATTA